MDTPIQTVDVHLLAKAQGLLEVAVNRVYRTWDQVDPLLHQYRLMRPLWETWKKNWGRESWSCSTWERTWMRMRWLFVRLEKVFPSSPKTKMDQCGQWHRQLTVFEAFQLKMSDWKYIWLKIYEKQRRYEDTTKSTYNLKPLKSIP